MFTNYDYTCKKCGKDYRVSLGIGAMFPRMYQKILENIRNGRFGETAKELAAANPNLAVDAESYFYKCDSCSGWDYGTDMSLYVPIDPENLQVKTSTCGMAADADGSELPYVTADDLRNNYRLLRRYHHKCPKCGKEMRRITDGDELRSILGALPCPACGEPNQGKPVSED